MTVQASKGKKWFFIGIGFTALCIIIALVIMLNVWGWDVLISSDAILLYVLLGCLGLVALGYAVHDWMKRL